MTDQHDDQLQRLQQALQSTQVPSDDPMRRLAEALVPDDSYSHKQAELDLPGYVNAALLGQPATQQYPALHRHLLGCPQCAALHVAMLHDLTAEPAEVAVPQPDLSFLPGTYMRRLRSATLRLAQQIGAVLFPDSLPALAEMAELLLDELQELGPNLRASPTPGVALGFASGDLPDEIKLLVATWLATRQLGENFDADDITQLQRTGEWPSAVRQAAVEAAADLGYSRERAIQFAQVYAGLTAADPNAIPAQQILSD